MTLNLNIAQVAYFVDDIENQARKMAATFGAGPFYIVRDIKLAWGEHRGKSCPFVHSSAYGQWGDIMLELVQQDSDGPSPFRDLYPPGKTGLHHVATIVENLPEAYQYFAQHNIHLATRAMTQTGTEFSFLDATDTLGHFIEVYESSDALLSFYDKIRNASHHWNGNEPVRTI